LRLSSKASGHFENAARSAGVFFTALLLGRNPVAALGGKLALMVAILGCQDALLDYCWPEM
jgi:hypothetical protein